MKRAFRTAVIAMSCMSIRGMAQSQSLSQRVITARALYYTPTTAGLSSFGCAVSFDWKKFLSDVNGKEIADSDPFLKYLNSVHLSVSDNLRTSGALKWVNASTPAEVIQDPATKMQQGLMQMFQGFFESWNAYLNGTMVPAPDKSTTLTAKRDGIHLHATGGKAILDEEFDNNMLLTQAHVVTDQMDVLAVPIFTDTPDGRVVSEIRNEARQPPTAPPITANMFVTYQKVQGYRIPESIRYEVKNVANMEFKLSNCAINSEKEESAAAQKP